MYYKNYEDYMRRVLGYPVESKDTYEINYPENVQNINIVDQEINQLQEYYPEIYRIINPVVYEICDKRSLELTKEALDIMVNEVYSRIENDKEIMSKLNIENRSIDNVNHRIDNRVNNLNIRKNIEDENRNKRLYNQLLKDIIKIMIINKLIENKKHQRPQNIRPPIRPQFPTEGGMWNPEHRIYEDNNY